MSECVFFSDAADVMAWNEELQANNVAWHDRLSELEAQNPGRRVVVVKSRRRWDAVGLDGDVSPGPLWRRRDWFWVPSKATKAGKSLAAIVDGLGFDIRPIPGMPREVWCENPRDWHSQIIKTPGTLVAQGGMWVHWDVAADRLRSSDEMRTDVVDESMWTERKLSEFHAAKEQQEEDEAAS